MLLLLLQLLPCNSWPQKPLVRQEKTTCISHCWLLWLLVGSNTCRHGKLKRCQLNQHRPTIDCWHREAQNKRDVFVFWRSWEGYYCQRSFLYCTRVTPERVQLHPTAIPSVHIFMYTWMFHHGVKLLEHHCVKLWEQEVSLTGYPWTWYL